jgi:hypothetical protein
VGCVGGDEHHIHIEQLLENQRRPDEYTFKGILKPPEIPPLLMVLRAMMMFPLHVAPFPQGVHDSGVAISLNGLNADESNIGIWGWADAV